MERSQRQRLHAASLVRLIWEKLNFLFVMTLMKHVFPQKSPPLPLVFPPFLKVWSFIRSLIGILFQFCSLVPPKLFRYNKFFVKVNIRELLNNRSQNIFFQSIWICFTTYIFVLIQIEKINSNNSFCTYL